MKIDNLDDLMALVATAETGSLTAAGKRCGRGTAAISAAIRRLEAAVGVRLFERTTRMVRLTAEGQILLDCARQSLALLEQGASQLSERTNVLEGRVRLTTSALLAHEVVAPWLGRFSALHPQLEVELEVSDSVLDLVREALDLALRYGPLPDSSLSARLLADTHYAACASPAYLARMGQPHHPAELAHHACLRYPARGRLMNAWEFTPAHAPRGAQILIETTGHMVANDASIAHQWALSGCGVVYQTELACRTALDAGTLVRLFPGFVGKPAPLYAVLPSNRYVSRRVQAMVDDFAAALADRPWSGSAR